MGILRCDFASRVHLVKTIWASDPTVWNFNQNTAPGFFFFHTSQNNLDSYDHKIKPSSIIGLSYLTSPSVGGKRFHSRLQTEGMVAFVTHVTHQHFSVLSWVSTKRKRGLCKMGQHKGLNTWTAKCFEGFLIWYYSHMDDNRQGVSPLGTVIFRRFPEQNMFLHNALLLSLTFFPFFQGKDFPRQVYSLRLFSSLVWGWSEVSTRYWISVFQQVSVLFVTMLMNEGMHESEERSSLFLSWLICTLCSDFAKIARIICCCYVIICCCLNTLKFTDWLPIVDDYLQKAVLLCCIQYH